MRLDLRVDANRISTRIFVVDNGNGISNANGTACFSHFSRPGDWTAGLEWDLKSLAQCLPHTAQQSRCKTHPIEAPIPGHHPAIERLGGWSRHFWHFSTKNAVRKRNLGNAVASDKLLVIMRTEFGLFCR